MKIWIKILLASNIIYLPIQAQDLVEDKAINPQQDTRNTHKASTKFLTGGTFENLDLKAYYWGRGDGYQKTDRKMLPVDTQNTVLLVDEDLQLGKNESDINRFFNDETVVLVDKEVYRRENSARNNYNYVLTKIVSLNILPYLNDFDKDRGTNTSAEYALHIDNFEERKNTILKAHERAEFKDEAFDSLFKDMADYYRGLRNIKRKVKFYLDHKDQFKNL